MLVFDKKYANIDPIEIQSRSIADSSSAEFEKAKSALVSSKLCCYPDIFSMEKKRTPQVRQQTCPLFTVPLPQYVNHRDRGKVDLKRICHPVHPFKKEIREVGN
jgi:hypothetical protein